MRRNNGSVRFFVRSEIKFNSRVAGDANSSNQIKRKKNCHLMGEIDKNEIK